MVYDAVVVGGGLVGASVAGSLARDGLSVALLERGVCAEEASWAAAGVLTEIVPRTIPPALIGLIREGLEHIEDDARELSARSGIDVHFRRSGMLRVAFSEDEVADLQLYRETTQAEGLHGDLLEPSELRELDDAIADHAVAGLYLPHAAQVDNAALSRAAVAVAVSDGVALHENTPVTGFTHDGARVTGVQAGGKTFSAGLVVLATGAWTGELVRKTGLDLPVGPVRGQIAVLRKGPGDPRHMINARAKYLVPRDEDLVVGSTQEFETGFVKDVTVQGLRQILDFVAECLPRLRDRAVIRTWAGLRPGSADDAPYIGPIHARPGLWLAAGHFTKGIVLGPLTGRLVAEAVRSASPPELMVPFAPDRHLRVTASVESSVD